MRGPDVGTSASVQMLSPDGNLVLSTIRPPTCSPNNRYAIIKKLERFCWIAGSKPQQEHSKVSQAKVSK